jgi:hypothetical protein
MALSVPDPTYDSESTRRLCPSLPLFEGFPYLVTRVVPAMYHVILVPADASELELVLLGRTQWRANRLEVCLVTGVDRAWFISADGRDRLAAAPSSPASSSPPDHGRTPRTSRRASGASTRSPRRIAGRAATSSAT